LSHDTIQKWINEAVVGSGIPRTFTMHCYHHSGMQYCFMFTPVGQRWTLVWVQWWGGWAEGEHVSTSQLTPCLSLHMTTQHDTLMHYLLNELNCYKNNHSDVLQP
ncbi:hypothetical protein BKA82DRAFT_3944124, partial [Pisolithus tinctorius]